MEKDNFTVLNTIRAEKDAQEKAHREEQMDKLVDSFKYLAEIIDEIIETDDPLLTVTFIMLHTSFHYNIMRLKDKLSRDVANK